jgi:hypothetical protein
VAKISTKSKLGPYAHHRLSLAMPPKLKNKAKMVYMPAGKYYLSILLYFKHLNLSLTMLTAQRRSRATTGASIMVRE